jgi:hypothetical protein
MPIRPHLTDPAAFEPEAIQAMSMAFELACAVCGDIPGRQIIARRIIDLASGGTVDAAALHQRVVGEARVSV